MVTPHLPASGFELPDDPSIPPAVFSDLNWFQALGKSCVVCRASFWLPDNRPVPVPVVVGRAWSTGRLVKACEERCAPLIGYVPPSTAVQETLL